MNFEYTELNYVFFKKKREKKDIMHLKRNQNTHKNNNTSTITKIVFTSMCKNTEVTRLDLMTSSLQTTVLLRVRIDSKSHF